MKSFGFTLVELLIVLLTLGLIGVLGYNGVNSTLEVLSLYNSAVLLANDIKECQNISMQEGVISRVVLDLVGDRYYLVRVENTPKVFKTVPLIGGIDLNWTNFTKYRIEFDPVGCPDMRDVGTPDRGGTVALKSRNKWMYVIITPVTGHVRISEKLP
jgi:hypothetical protein